MKTRWTAFAISLFIALANAGVASAASSTTPGGSALAGLIEYGLSHSSSISASQAEIDLQESNLTRAKVDRYVPRVDLNAAFQSHKYDDLYGTSKGVAVRNDGTNPIFGAVVTYDLQKLFGPAIEAASESVKYAKIQDKLARREIVRAIKKAYYSIREIDSDLVLLQKLITLFGRIDQVLQKQHKLGVYNELERKQFNVQRGLLLSDVQTRTTDLDAALAALSTAAQMPMAEVKEKIAQAQAQDDSLVHTADFSKLPPSYADTLSEGAVIKNLSRDFNLAKLQYEKFTSVPLPTVYGKVTRESPTMPSSDGPQTAVEVGISLPLDGFITRSADKKILANQSAKNEAIFEKNLYDYRNNVRLLLMSLDQQNRQTKDLVAMRAESEKLLDNSFLFYSQRRVDAFGTLDIFQKYLQTSRLVLLNELQMKNLNIDLEYLLGDASL